jgi:nucleotide-binding universal stress UspA family protein
MEAPTRTGSDAAAHVFSRILCGIDATPESVEAARQAAQLAPADAELVLAAVPAAPLLETLGTAGWRAPAAPVVDHEPDARAALERAREALGASARVTLRVLPGSPVPALLAELARDAATLVAVGSHGHRRGSGIAIGSVATALLHEAPCSVLVTRAAGGGLPASIAIGYDGSPAAAAALDVARSLADRCEAGLRVVAARGGERVDLEGMRASLADAADAAVVEDDRDPVTALVEAGADLLVVGSRGLHGLRALGSVSERVAHRARCSVLVVRGGVS